MIICHILQHPIWVCTVCQLPFWGIQTEKGLNGNDFKIKRIIVLIESEKKQTNKNNNKKKQEQQTNK